MTRHDIQNAIASTIAATTGFTVEVTMSESKARGPFMSLFGTIEALDAARVIMDGVGNLRFSDRDIDPDDDEQCDFYSVI